MNPSPYPDSYLVRKSTDSKFMDIVVNIESAEEFRILGVFERVIAQKQAKHAFGQEPRSRASHAFGESGSPEAEFLMLLGRVGT